MEYSKEVLEKAKMAVEIGNAILQGKKIQCEYSDYWEDSNTPSLNFSNYTYRVKPTTKYVPFTFEDAKDLIGKAIVKMDGTQVQKVVQLNKDYVFAGVGQMDYKWLFNEYTFLDGTPCGKLENQ